MSDENNNPPELNHLQRIKTRRRIIHPVAEKEEESEIMHKYSHKKTPKIVLPFYILLIVAVNLVHESTAAYQTLNPTPTTVSKAYADIPTTPTYKKIFYTRTRMTPMDASNKNPKLTKPSKLFTNEPLMDSGFMAYTTTTTTTTTPAPSSTTKRISSHFLAQTDTGPKIRLEPFFNILSTFQSLALGTSKEQKFSPSYQTFSESMGQAENHTFHSNNIKKNKNKRNKGTKGLRQKNNKFTPNDGGPIPIPLPKPLIIEEDETPIITEEDIPHNVVKPLDVLSVSISTSMQMGGNNPSPTVPSKGTIESVPLLLTQSSSFFPKKKSKSSKNSGERRLRSENYFENFHNSEVDLQAEENHLPKNQSTPSSMIMPAGHAFPNDQNFKPNYDEYFPSIALGVPPSHFYHPKTNFHPKYPFNPNHHNYQHSYNHQHKPNEATSDLGEQQSSANSKLEEVTVNNQHQRIGIMDSFELFFKQYKILAWAGFFVVSALAVLCLLVFLYTNNPPTEVVTARSLELLRNPQIMKFLESLVQTNEKLGGNGKRKRKKFKQKGIK